MSPHAPPGGPPLPPTPSPAPTPPQARAGAHATRHARRTRTRQARTRHAVLALLLALAALLVQRLAGSTSALLLLLVAAGTWLLAAPSAALAQRWGLRALPSAREGPRRTLPRAAGLALLLPLLAAGALAGGPLPAGLVPGDLHGAPASSAGEPARMASLLAACLALAVVGLLDDRRPMRPALRVVLQAGAGALLASGGWSPLALTLGTLHVQLASEALAWSLCIGWVLLCTQALRWMDTLEGLSAGLGLVAAVLALLAGAQPLAPALLAGASLGLLGPTLPPARALGGSGASLVLGLLLAASTLALPAPTDAVLALALVAYPLGDMAIALVRRALRAKPLWLPDHSHVHHKLGGLLRSRRLALLAVLAFAALLGTLSEGRTALAALGTMLLAWALLLGLLLRLVGEPLGAMWRHRADFRRLHLVRPYVTHMLLLSRREREAREALQRMAVDLDLAWLDLPGHGRLHHDPRIEGAVEQRIALAHGAASLGSVPSDLPALDRDRRALLADLLHLAEARLERLRLTRTPPPHGAAPSSPHAGPHGSPHVPAS